MKSAITCGALLAIALYTLVALFIDTCGLFPSSYKKGQVDALSGNIKYELTVWPDSTRAWTRIKDAR